MSETANPDQKTFYERKAARKHHYETHIKGWRLRVCPVCCGDGTQGHFMNCSHCSGDGQKWSKPDCVTDIGPLIGETLRIEIAPEIDLRLHIQNSRRVVKQFIATDDDTRDPRIYAKLEFGHDEANDVEDWYVTDTFGGRVYLHQFKRIDRKTA